MDFPGYFLLHNGLSVPAVGLGTYVSEAGGTTVEEHVLSAIAVGYRHFDTALGYGSEDEVGRALRRSGLARNEMFITTKLPQAWHRPGDVPRALDKSLENLGLEYVDLYLMHFPQAYVPGEGNSAIRDSNGRPTVDLELSRNYTATWTAMEALVDSGKARAIGLSNFNMLKTKRVLGMARIRPVVNQVELHPFLPQEDLVQFVEKAIFS